MKEFLSGEIRAVKQHLRKLMEASPLWGYLKKKKDKC